LSKEKAGARLPTLRPPVTVAFFPFDEVSVLFLVKDWPDFFAAVFLVVTFAFAGFFEELGAVFFVLLD
jgi:hypothetical protein